MPRGLIITGFLPVSQRDWEYGMRFLGIILTLAALGGGGYYGYQKWKGDDAGSEFVTVKLARGDITKTVSATGTVEPLVKVVIGSQVSGQIMKWFTDFNAPVTAGMIMAELDPQRFVSARDQALADLAIAKAGEEEARVRHKDLERERDRIVRLRATQTASENEQLVAQAAADAAHAAWMGAKARVESAEALLRAVEVDLDRTTIRAPMDGVVISRDIDVGQTVAASLQAPTLFTIANDLSNMQVNANVSEADIGLIKEGMSSSFTVDAYPTRTFHGTISQIRYNATVLDSVVTYVTLIQVKNEDLALRPGMTANVTFEVAKAEDVVKLPNAALRFNPAPPQPNQPPVSTQKSTGPTIYRLVNGRPKAVSVKIGLSDGTSTELVQGEIREGDEVVTDRDWTAGGRRRPDMAQSMGPRRM